METIGIYFVTPGYFWNPEKSNWSLVMNYFIRMPFVTDFFCNPEKIKLQQFLLFILPGKMKR